MKKKVQEKTLHVTNDEPAVKKAKVRIVAKNAVANYFLPNYIMFRKVVFCGDGIRQIELVCLDSAS